MTLAAISDIDTGERVRREMGDIEGLARSIDAVGLLHPVVVMGQPDGNRWTLVAGERRLRACRDILGWERIHVRIVPDTTDLLRAEHDENVVREPFTPSEAVAIARMLRPAAEAAARERMERGTPSADSAQGRTRDAVAKAVGMSHDTLTKAEAVVEAVAEEPALAPIQEAMDEAHNVAGAHAAIEALPPDPEPAAVEAAATAVRRRRPRVAADDPINATTDRHRALFPQVAAADLSADLADAIAAMRTDRLSAARWADRVPDMRPEDIERVRSKVAHVHRWADEWDALLAPRPLTVVGGSRP